MRSVVIAFIVGAIWGVVVLFMFLLMVGGGEYLYYFLPYTPLIGGVIGVVLRGIKYVIDMPGYESTVETPEDPPTESFPTRPDFPP